MPNDLFSILDWSIIGGYLLLTTWVGHLLKGKQATIDDFFLGGRTLPWQAVSGSIIATEISGVTFIGVPGIVYAMNGNFTYLQWGIGSILARVLVGVFFVKFFYSKNCYSPYDFMGQQLGKWVKVLATILFSLGSILGQSVRVLVAALPLTIITGIDMGWCILIIGLFAIGWTCLGGMRTVIWTDVMQFFLFTVGGLVALFVIINQLNGGWSDFITTAGEAGKFQIFDTRFEANLKFTIWVAILAVPFQNLSAFGVDQLNAQRIFCCKNPSDARKAIIFSSVGQLLTMLMLLVGAGLFVYYKEFPPAEWQSLLFNKSNDYVFPTWIVTNLPDGVRGLILAGVFAAAISSLDSILAALSQTSLSIISKSPLETAAQQKAYLFKSKIMVVIWGILLSGFTWMLFTSKDKISILPLAFGLTSYTMGPMLGIFLVAILGKCNKLGLILGVVTSLCLTAILRTDIYSLIASLDFINASRIGSNLGRLPTLDWSSETQKLTPLFADVWMWPVGCILTIAGGYLPTLFRASAKIQPSTEK